jgi:2-oxoisovalerate dehydrogenase E2 component (dihydrolipoyl transacylase)
VSNYVFKLPDLGEGTVEAEIVNWRVKPGDSVAEDDVLVEVMTEKAAVEVPAPVGGRVVSTTGAPGDMVPVGAELIVIETSASAGTPQPPAADPPPPQAPPVPAAAARAHAASNGAAPAEVPARNARIATSPAIRRRAHEAGIDLQQITGSGPNGRIVPKDLEAYVARRGAGATPLRAAPKAVPGNRAPVAATEEIKVIGLRRLIAQRMSEAKRNIPHFAYVEELDITELDSLRRHLNRKPPGGAAALTYLPFLALALVRVLKDFPQCNAHYDAERGVIVRHAAVHLGVATQTPEGLKVPVVHDAQNLGLWELAAQMRRVSEAARSNKARREELTGSTITITSLGKLGGIASTPIINAPEVAIIGVNRAVERPLVIEGAIAIRLTMNLSSSFDHRFVDGYDAAAMIQALKESLEHPATIFMPA